MFISYSSVVIQCCSKIDLTVFWWYFGPLYKVFAPVKLVFLKKNQTWQIKSEVLSLGELTLVMLWWCKFLPEMPVLRYVLLLPCVLCTSRNGYPSDHLFYACIRQTSLLFVKLIFHLWHPLLDFLQCFSACPGFPHNLCWNSHFHMSQSGKRSIVFQGIATSSTYVEAK